MKEWSGIEVILQIAKAFEDKMGPNGVDFEILHSVHILHSSHQHFRTNIAFSEIISWYVLGQPSNF